MRQSRKAGARGKMWMDELKCLNDRDRESFSRLVNLLLARTFLIRERVDPRDKSLAIDRDFRFLERYHSLLRGYLDVAGWDLKLDSLLGVAALYNRSGSNRYRLNKVESYFLLVLRLIYAEAAEKLTLRRDVTCSVRDLLEKLSMFNLLEKKLSDKSLSEGLSTLREFNLIDRVEGEWSEPETQLVIYPSVLLAVNEEQIRQLYEASRQWKSAREEVLEPDENAAQTPAD